MKYIEYGTTGKKVSVVGFGALRFDLSKSNEENSKLVTYAYEKGINYFDTAPGYCDDRSEDILGIAFRKLLSENKTDFFVSTKGRPTVFDTAQKAIDGVKKSLERLGVPKIHFYHIWCIRKMEHYELAMKPGGQYEGLLKCKEEGLIDHIVFSSHQPSDEVINILKDNKFDGVTMGLNVLNFSYREQGANYATKNGLGVVAMNPLSGGEIPKNEKELSFLTDNSESVTSMAIRFNVSSKDITISLIGFGSEKDIDMACDIVDNKKLFTNEELSSIQSKLGENMNSICTGCGYCKDCPVGINVAGYMLLYNQKQMFKKDEQEMINMVYGLEYWNYANNSNVKSHECINCGNCEKECTQHLNIIDRLKEISIWEEKGIDNVRV